MLFFILGIITGLLIRQIQNNTKSPKTYIDAVKTKINPPKVQFIDSIPFKEKFEKSNNINELLKESHDE